MPSGILSIESVGKASYMLGTRSPTGQSGRFNDVPKEPILIKEVVRVP